MNGHFSRFVCVCLLFSKVRDKSPLYFSDIQPKGGIMDRKRLFLQLSLGIALTLGLVLSFAFCLSLETLAAPISMDMESLKIVSSGPTVLPGTIPGPGRSSYLPLVVNTQIRPRAEWTAQWWQWIEALNSEPLYEEGDVDCARGQSGDVWFLAGTAGGPPATRTCTIPEGTVLLVPLQNAAWSNEGAEDLSVEEKRAVLEAVYSVTDPGILNSKICGLESQVDGKDVPYMRLQSPTFLRLDDPESVSDGFWFAFQPSVGAHQVVFSGTLCDFFSDMPIFEIAVTYEITVE